MNKIRVNPQKSIHSTFNQFLESMKFQPTSETMYYTLDKSSVKRLNPLFVPSMQADQGDDDEKQLCGWSNNGDTLTSKFCMDSSLHGLKFIGQPRRYTFERIFWLAAFIISGIGCALTIMTLFTKYWESPVVTVFQPTQTPVDFIPFPAITICNVNNVRKTRALQYVRRAEDKRLSYREKLEAYSDLYDLNHICEASTTFAQRFNVSERNVVDPQLIEEVLKLRNELPSSDPTRILRKATQNCSELILLCLWLDEIQDCSTFFHGVETDYGFCCTFNVVPLSLLLRDRNDARDNPTAIKEWRAVTEGSKFNILKAAIENTEGAKTRKRKLPKYPYRQVYHGRSSGLSLLLDPDLEEYFCTNTDADGFVIGASHPLNFPRVRDHGIAVSPNSETFMSINPDLTIADPSIFSFSIDKRQCYVADEFQLRYYSYYTPSNCVDECIANHTLEMCQCIQYYMPRSNDQQLCSPEQFECTERVREDVIQKGLLKECSKCLPSCNDLSYQVETTFLDMRDGVFKPEAFPGINKSLNGRNMTIVHLYMGVDSTYPRLRKELYSIIDLISSTGGLLSLCLGFSILSVLEIVYFFTIRVCLRSYKRYLLSKSRPSFSVDSQQNFRIFPGTQWTPQNAWGNNSTPQPVASNIFNYNTRQFTVEPFKMIN